LFQEAIIEPVGVDLRSSQKRRETQEDRIGTAGEHEGQRRRAKASPIRCAIRRSKALKSLIDEVERGWVLEGGSVPGENLHTRGTALLGQFLDQEAFPDTRLAKDPGEASDTLARRFESPAKRIENLAPSDESTRRPLGR
jgi:hypothetical protein